MEQVSYPQKKLLRRVYLSHRKGQHLASGPYPNGQEKRLDTKVRKRSSHRSAPVERVASCHVEPFIHFHPSSLPRLNFFRTSRQRGQRKGAWAMTRSCFRWWLRRAPRIPKTWSSEMSRSVDWRITWPSKDWCHISQCSFWHGLLNLLEDSEHEITTVYNDFGPESLCGFLEILIYLEHTIHSLLLWPLALHGNASGNLHNLLSQERFWCPKKLSVENTCKQFRTHQNTPKQIALLHPFKGRPWTPKPNNQIGRVLWRVCNLNAFQILTSRCGISLHTVHRKKWCEQQTLDIN